MPSVIRTMYELKNVLFGQVVFSDSQTTCHRESIIVYSVYVTRNDTFPASTVYLTSQADCQLRTAAT